MNIKGVNANNVVNLYSKNIVKKVDSVETVRPKDRIEISSVAKSLGVYDSSSLSFDNSAKVEEIKQKIASGTYNVSGRLTAQSMMDFIREGRELHG